MEERPWAGFLSQPRNIWGGNEVLFSADREDAAKDDLKALYVSGDSETIR
jgi:hypothetical protein